MPPSTPPSPSLLPATSSADLCLVLPTVEFLTEILHTTLEASSDEAKLSWAHEVVRLVDRQIKVIAHQPSSATLAKDGPPPLPESINALVEYAIPIVISYASHEDNKISSHASYLKGHLLSSGTCPEILPKDSRQAFKDFEVAARGGYVRGWFRLGRDYESCGETERAKQCFGRGVKKGDGECTYRMGMAHLMGQLDLPASPELAFPLLRLAAEAATVDAPQAAYVLGMLLAGEFDQILIPPNIMLPPTTPPCTALDAQHSEANRLIHRAAYLGFSPALYKSGYMYEHASLTAPFDPLLSVQYYALASQCGEVEADMALSKWFLVGAEGCFEKNERMARTFAQKAAKAGLASGCFALGYYYELGIGGRTDFEQAKRWYAKAAQRGNREASGRIQALSTGTPSTVSVQEHQQALNSTLIRRRTAAKQRSDSVRQQHPGGRHAHVERERMEAIQEASRASRFGMVHATGGSGSSFSNVDLEEDDRDHGAGRGGTPKSFATPGQQLTGYSADQFRLAGRHSPSPPPPMLPLQATGNTIAFPEPQIRGTLTPTHHRVHSVPPPSTLPPRSSLASPSIPQTRSPHVRPLELRRVSVPHGMPPSMSTPTLPLATPALRQHASPQLRPQHMANLGPTHGTAGLGFEALSIASPNPGKRQAPIREKRQGAYSLTDDGPAVGASPVQRHSRAADEPEYKGVGTFEEMGFRSKPVEDDGCVVM